MIFRMAIYILQRAERGWIVIRKVIGGIETIRRNVTAFVGLSLVPSWYVESGCVVQATQLSTS